MTEDQAKEMIDILSTIKATMLWVAIAPPVVGVIVGLIVFFNTF